MLRSSCRRAEAEGSDRLPWESADGNQLKSTRLCGIQVSTVSLAVGHGLLTPPERAIGVIKVPAADL